MPSQQLFQSQKKRYLVPHGFNRWYELDSFLMRGNQRHKFARKISTISEASLSDHKPVVLKIELKNKLKKRKGRR